MANKSGYGIRVGSGVFCEAWGHVSPDKRYVPPRSGLTKAQRDAIYYAKHADEINEARRVQHREVAIRRELEDAAAGRWETVPPCGGDCLQCPYNDGCRYADWEEKAAEEKARQNPRRAEFERAKERYHTDPEYRDRRLETYKKSRRRRLWIKIGMPPEDFEQAYADGTYDAIMEARRHAPRKKTAGQDKK